MCETSSPEPFYLSWGSWKTALWSTKSDSVIKVKDSNDFFMMLSLITQSHLGFIFFVAASSVQTPVISPSRGYDLSFLAILVA